MWHLDEDQPQEPAVSYVVDELEKLGYSWAHRVISLAGLDCLNVVNAYSSSQVSMGIQGTFFYQPKVSVRANAST